MTWWYWSGTEWAAVSDADLVTLAPTIVCGRLQGSGSLDPSIRIAVGDALSMEIAIAQHRRFKTGRGKR